MILDLRFKTTGKQISDRAAAEIVQKANRIPFYCQLLASHCWYNTPRNCSLDLVEEAYESMVLQNSLYFQTITDKLTTMQIRLLKAVNSDGFQPYSMEYIRRFDLQSTSHVARVQKSLIRQEIIIFDHGETIILNPLYGYWLKDHYFR